MFSMDIEKMYPSADVDEVCRVAADEWFNSNLELDINPTELALYLAVVYKRDFLMSLRLGDVTHTQLKRNGPKPGITTPEILTRTHDTASKFVPPRRFSTDQERRMMTKLALEILMKTSLKSHMYTFNGEIRLQMTGGAIGDILTGAIMSVYVLHWARILKQRLATLGIAPHLFKIYIDDQNFIIKGLSPGSRIVGDRIVIDEDEVEADRSIPCDLRSARLVQSVANSISHWHWCQVTIDCPSQHNEEQGFMPILDVQAKIVSDRVVYKLYKKKVSRKTVIHASSALPANTKKHALVNEGLREGFPEPVPGCGLRYGPAFVPASVLRV